MMGYNLMMGKRRVWKKKKKKKKKQQKTDRHYTHSCPGGEEGEKSMINPNILILQNRMQVE